MGIKNSEIYQSILQQGSHRFGKLKIKENRGDLMGNFLILQEKFVKNEGESRRF